MNKGILIKTHKDNLIDVVMLTNCPQETIYVFDDFSKTIKKIDQVKRINYRKFIEENVTNKN